MDTNSNTTPDEKIILNYKKIIELKDNMIANLNKQIEMMKQTQKENPIIPLLKAQLDNCESQIELLNEYNVSLKKSVELLKKFIGDEKYVIGDYVLDELANNEYIVFLLNKFKFYNFERMKNYSGYNTGPKTGTEPDNLFNTYKDFIEFNKIEYAGLAKKESEFLSKLISKIENGKISIGSNVHFNIWKANVFYINADKKICINHPR
jgi:hypothetical protein